MSLKIFQTLNMLARQINNVADPTSAQDAATKAYVDAHSGGGGGGYATGTGGVSVTLAPGDISNTAITVSGAALGKLAVAAFSAALPAGVFASCSVTAANTATLSLLNLSSSSQTLALTATVGVFA